MKKKILSVTLLLALTLCLFGCGNNDKNTGSSGTNVSSNKGTEGSYSLDTKGNIVDGNGNVVNDNFGIDDSGNIVDNQGNVVGNTSDGQYDPDNNSSEGYSSGDYSGNGNNLNMPGGHEHDILKMTIYKIDADTVHVRVEDTKNSGIMGSDINQIYVRINNGTDNMEIGGFSFSRDYASFGYYTNNGTEWVSAGSYENLALYTYVAGATFRGTGIGNGITEGMTYTIEIYSNSGNSDPIYGESKIDSIKSVSEQDVALLIAEESLAFVPENKAHNTWEGQYVYCNSYYDDSDYVYEYGIANISLTEYEAIKVELLGKAETRIYVFEEKDYDEVTYDYGTVVQASADLPTEDYHNEADLKYTKEVDSPVEYRLEARFYKNNKYYNYSYSFIPMGAAATAAPENFSDTDKYGYVEAILKDKDHFLYPSCDNYIIKVSKIKDSVYNNSTSEYTYYPGVSITLYEFDINDFCLKTKSVTTYEDASAASAIYGYKKSWYTSASTYFNMTGNEVRYSQASDYYNEKAYYTKSYLTYDGMHYADSSYNYDDTMDYLYSSKPFDSGKMIPNKELIMLTTSIPNGTHRSLDSQNATMYTSFSASTYSGISLYFNVYGNNDFNVSSDYAVYEGMSAYSISYSTNWSTNTNYVNVDEIVFGAEETTATRYKYKVSDFTNVSITLDNFRSMTPDSTESHRYDMTRIKE